MGAPTLAGFGPNAVLSEHTATPQLFDTGLTFGDAGRIAIGALTPPGPLAGDIIQLRNQGTGTGEIGLSGMSVTDEDGSAGKTLTVTFNAAGAAEFGE